jgi:hypothetical protein
MVIQNANLKHSQVNRIANKSPENGNSSVDQQYLHLELKLATDTKKPPKIMSADRSVKYIFRDNRPQRNGNKQKGRYPIYPKISKTYNIQSSKAILQNDAGVQWSDALSNIKVNIKKPNSPERQTNDSWTQSNQPSFPEIGNVIGNQSDYGDNIMYKPKRRFRNIKVSSKKDASVGNDTGSFGTLRELENRPEYSTVDPTHNNSYILRSQNFKDEHSWRSQDLLSQIDNGLSMQPNSSKTRKAKVMFRASNPTTEVKKFYMYSQKMHKFMTGDKSKSENPMSYDSKVFTFIL